MRASRPFSIGSIGSGSICRIGPTASIARIACAACICCSVATFSATLLIASSASAFVSPGYHASRARRTLLGKWRIVGNRKGGVVEDIDPSVRILITPQTMQRSRGGVTDPNVGRYDVTHEDDNTLDLRIVFLSQVLDADVLVETPDAVTLYLRDEHDDDERAIRLERVED